MTQETFSAVDAYLLDHLIPSDPILEATLRESDRAGLPKIQVSATQGKLLQLLVQIKAARSILEIGTLGGYSTTWLARGLPEDGHLVSLEINPKHAEVAIANIARAGFADVVSVRVGPALESLAQLVAEQAGPFDFIFIDADKPNNPNYLEWSLQLARPGTVIVVDNVVRNGSIANPHSTDSNVIGAQQFFDLAAKTSRLSATTIQTVGSKGYDGFCLGIVLP